MPSQQAYADIRKIKPELVFELIDVDAAAIAAAAASKGTYFSQLNQTHNRLVYMSKNLATLEPFSWILDGTRQIYDHSNPLEVGYWSEVLSDENRNIDISLTYTFSTPQSSAGFSICFDTQANNFASDFNIKTYDDSDVLLNEVYITDNQKTIADVILKSDNYSKVVINITKTAEAFRRVRISETVFGFMQYFSEDDIEKINLSNEVSKNMDRFPSSFLEVTIDNSEGQYNIHNPQGIYRFLQKGQGLNVSVKINDEQTSIGRYYFANAQSSNNSLTATISAYDRAFMLENSFYNFGADGTWTVEQAVTSVITDSKLIIETIIPDNIKNRVINKCIPLNTSHREALRLIAQAARSICYFNKTDQLIFKEYDFSDGVTYTTDMMKSWPVIKDVGYINRVELVSENQFTETKVEFISEDRAADEQIFSLKIDNCLAREQIVADWLLAVAKLRTQADISEMGDPLLEVLDSVYIPDKFGNVLSGNVIKHSFSFDGGMNCTTTAILNNV